MWQDLQFDSWIDRGQANTLEDQQNTITERQKALEMWGKN